MNGGGEARGQDGSEEEEGAGEELMAGPLALSAGDRSVLGVEVLRDRQGE